MTIFLSYSRNSILSAGFLLSLPFAAHAVGPNPTVPGALHASPFSASQIHLSWSASTISKGSIQNYKIYRNGSALVTVPGSSLYYDDINLAPSTAYSYQVQAVASAGTTSALSSAVSATTLPAPSPSSPQTVLATPVSSSDIRLTWNSSSISSGSIASYQVYQDGQLLSVSLSSSTRSYIVSSLTPATSYSFSLTATSDLGLVSAMSAVVNATTFSVPTIPQNLQARVVKTTEVDLSWDASSIPSGSVQMYRVFRNGTLIVSVENMTSYNDTGLTESNNYTYQIQAVSDTGAVSALSAPVSVTPMPNLADNPGFESDLTGWQNQGNAEIFLGNNNVYLMGLKQVKIGTAAGGVAQNVSVKLSPGTAYDLSVLAKVDALGDQGSVGVQFQDALGTIMVDQSAAVTATSFTQSLLHFVAPANSAAAFIYIQKNNGSSYLEGDNVYLRQSTP